MKKRLILFCILVPGIFSLFPQATEEDAAALARLYETLGSNFLLLITDLDEAADAAETAQVLNTYVQNNTELLADIRDLSEPFKDKTLLLDLERSVRTAKGSLNKMPEVYLRVQDWIGDSSVAEAWASFRAMFGLGGGQ